MPRISLYREEKGFNFNFIDRHISQLFQFGGTGLYYHKYLGPSENLEHSADQPLYNTTNVLNIQDLLFLENRDRKYETEVYRLRGKYDVQNLDFNLSQFGLFIDNDVIYMLVHINDSVKSLGRKPIAGDVIELPHLKDEFALNDYDISVPRFFVIEDVGRASEGFSPTWYPHLYRLKMKKIVDSQQYAELLILPIGDDADYFVGDYDPTVTYLKDQIIRYNGVLYTVLNDTQNNTPPNPDFFALYTGPTLKDVMSTSNKDLSINDSVIDQAEIDAPLSGYETRHLFTLAVDPTTGKPALIKTDNTYLDSSDTGYNADDVNLRAVRSSYTGMMVGDGDPQNGYAVGHGVSFPDYPEIDSFFLRTDYVPNRLFRFDGKKWIKIEDAVRMNMTNNDIRQTMKTSFINNRCYLYFDRVAIDHLNLSANSSIIDTNIDFITAPYLVIKTDGYELSFDYATYTDIYKPYMIDNVEKLRITLPIIFDNQVVIPFDSIWSVNLYSTRQEQRQSLSKILKPQADL